MVDRSELHLGAVVTVRATVTEVLTDAVRLMFNISGADDGWLGWAPLSSILSVAPRPLKVGEAVARAADGLPGFIRGIHNNHAWVQWDSDPPDFSTELLSDLTRIPNEPA